MRTNGTYDVTAVVVTPPSIGGPCAADDYRVTLPEALASVVSGQTQAANVVVDEAFDMPRRIVTCREPDLLPSVMDVQGVDVHVYPRYVFR